MHDGGTLSWREVVDKHHSALIDELKGRIDADLREAVADAVTVERATASAELDRACTDARRSQVESLNQVLRRLRSTAEGRIPGFLAEVCGSYAQQVVVLLFESNQARSAGAFGIQTAGVADGSIVFETTSAPAIVSAIESRDPVVALGNSTELSPELTEAFGTFVGSPAAKAYLFPVVARHTVVAMLVASGVEVSAPIELLCEAAGMRFDETGWEAKASASQFTPSAAASPAPPVPASATSAARSWDDLSPEDQKLHLQAQRLARVRVAEMRLYRENELRQGVASRDIYSALQKEIDSARDQFLQSFLSKSATMVDYLHLEILRSLAHDDDRLLGHNYPGPMV